MPGYSDPGFDTLALHAGAQPDPATGARAVPIHLTTSIVFESSEHAASLFNLERAGHVYSRISNPTNAVLEQRISALEGGIGAIATASGQAALHLAIATLMGAGSHMVASSALYGGSHRKEEELQKGEAALRASGAVAAQGNVKILTSCPSCLQGLSRFGDDLNNGLLEADYIVVEMANQILGKDWMPAYVEAANHGGIERVLV